MGVRGTGLQGFGVVGTTSGEWTGSFEPSGGRFQTFASNSVSLHAVVEDVLLSSPDNSIALLAEATAGNLAARFVGATEFNGTVLQTGNVSVVGTLQVEGPITQVIPPPEPGGPTQIFGIQAFDAWFEDFGEQALVGRTARVALRPAFVAVADVSSYHVFLVGVGGETPTVESKDATGFTVEVQNQGKAPTSFSYRVVAKRV